MANATALADFSFAADNSSSSSSSSSANATGNELGGDSGDWLSPVSLLSLLTTVLVPLVFGVIVVVGEFAKFHLSTLAATVSFVSSLSPHKQ